MPSYTGLCALAALLPTLVVGQLSGSVGPLTSRAAKAAVKTCNVLDYGAVANSDTDLGPAITAAFEACIDGGVVVIPEGDYELATWVDLSGGKAWAIQLDGIISRTGTAGGDMIYVEHSTDFELFSSTSKGAVQGNGYVFHAEGSISGPRILRLYDVTDFSVHDIALVDSPSFHFSMDTCENGEIYNMAIRGGNEGGLDGIDVWSTNMHIHDVMVTNKDECVTTKSPASNILIEDIYCNWSGGSALGSLGIDTNITDVTYRNIYTWSSNEMMMIKSNGGSGTVSNILFENFIGHGNAYSLDIDQYWSSMSPLAGDGVQLTNIVFKNWTGTEADGAERGPVKVVCAAEVPCKDIVIEDFAMWTEEGDYQINICESAYGSGFCLSDSDDYASYTTTTTVTVAPTGYAAPSMAADLTAAFGTTVSIPIPTVPTSFFPGATPLSALLGAASASSSVTTAVAVPSTKASTTSSMVSATSTKAATTSSKTTSTKASSTTTKAASSTMVTSTSVKAVSTSTAAVTTSKALSTASSKASVSSSSTSRRHHWGGNPPRAWNW